MLKDGALAWEIKDYLIQQERCEEVTLEGQSYKGKVSYVPYFNSHSRQAPVFTCLQFIFSKH